MSGAALELDHVNVRTGNLDRQLAFYVQALGLIPRPNPESSRRGWWLGSDSRIFLHLIEDDSALLPASPQLEHIGFRVSETSGLLEKLDEQGIEFRVSVHQGGATIRIHLRDPDGNRLHVDAPAPSPGLPALPRTAG